MSDRAARDRRWRACPACGAELPAGPAWTMSNGLRLLGNAAIALLWLPLAEAMHEGPRWSTLALRYECRRCRAQFVLDIPLWHTGKDKPCWNCGYELGPTKSVRCPECGVQQAAVGPGESQER